MAKKGKASRRASAMTLRKRKTMDSSSGTGDRGGEAGEAGEATASINNAGLDASCSVEARVVGMEEETIFRHIASFL